MEPRSVASHRRDPRPRARAKRPAGPPKRDRVVRGNAPRRRRPLRRDANRPLLDADAPVPRMALSRTGLGDDASPTRLVSIDGGTRRARADYRCRRARSSPDAMGRQRRRNADRLRAQPRRRRFTRHRRASRARVCEGPAGGGTRALRAGRLRAGHQRAG